MENPEDFELTPGEIAEIDQIAAEVADTLVPVPLPLLLKLLNRYRRLASLERDHMPGFFIQAERKLIQKAIDEIDAWADVITLPYPNLLMYPRIVMGDEVDDSN